MLSDLLIYQYVHTFIVYTMHFKHISQTVFVTVFSPCNQSIEHANDPSVGGCTICDRECAFELCARLTVSGFNKHACQAYRILASICNCSISFFSSSTCNPLAARVQKTANNKYEILFDIHIKPSHRNYEKRRARLVCLHLCRHQSESHRNRTTSDEPDCVQRPFALWTWQDFSRRTGTSPLGCPDVESGKRVTVDRIARDDKPVECG